MEIRAFADVISSEGEAGEGWALNPQDGCPYEKGRKTHVGRSLHVKMEAETGDAASPATGSCKSRDDPPPGASEGALLTP